MVSDRLLLASIHDVSPRFESEIDGLRDILAPHVGERFAMLVVPNHWGDAPIVAGSPFAAKLRKWSDAGVEIFLHGFYHRDDRRHAGTKALRANLMTAGEGEFLGLGKAEAKRRIEDGRALIEDVTGRPIAGFTAPAWLYGQEVRDALADCAIPIAESHWRVWSPATRAELARGPVITWASRSRARLASSLVAAAALRHSRARVLRLGVHPPDCRHRAIVSSIDKACRTAMRDRRAGRYSELQLEV
jgi:predicted deacetylase